MEIEKTILPIGYGTMGISFAPYSEQERINQLVLAIRELLKHTTKAQKAILNTAHIYGENKGDNEKLLGKAIAQLVEKERKKLIVLTWTGLCDISIETESENHDLIGPKEMYCINQAYSQFELSLENLKLNEFKDIELWAGLHRVNLHEDLDSQIQELKKITNNPRVTRVGLSEVSIKTMENFKKEGLKINFLETELSLSRQFVIKDSILRYCKENDIIVIAYSPIDRGIWTSRISTSGDWFDMSKHNSFLSLLSGWTDKKIVEHNFEERKKALDIAKKYDTDLNKVSLAWIIKKGAIPVPDSVKLQHNVSNFSALNFVNKLTDEDMKVLDSISFIGNRYK